MIERPSPSEPAKAPRRRRLRITRASATWTALGIAIVFLVALIVFIAQNSDHVRISFFVWHGRFAVGLALLVAAVAGACVTLLAGVARIRELQLRGRTKIGRRRARPSGDRPESSTLEAS